MADTNSIELLRDPTVRLSKASKAWPLACALGAERAGLSVLRSGVYRGTRHWLTFFGVGAAVYDAARQEHMQKGLPVVCWDLGYLGRSRDMSRNHVRVSINGAHPTHDHMERTPPDPTRWNKLGLTLREDARPDGPVLVIGMGRKSRKYLQIEDWETQTLHATAKRFPDRRIIFRPKISRTQNVDTVEWPDKSDTLGVSIEDALRGASLVICRHSNVAVDACIAGIPVECEAGAAHWLYSRTSTPTVEQRLDFLYRVCWWQWELNKDEMEQGWTFLKKAFG